MRCSTLAIAMIVINVGVAAAQQTEVVEHGQKVYTAQKCGICHSIAGKGNKNGPLDDVGSKLTPEEIRQWITDAPAMTAKSKATRKPPMKAYGALAKEDVDALVSYLQTLKK
jgi:mono/diheme cytochrome c family protein